MKFLVDTMKVTREPKIKIDDLGSMKVQTEYVLNIALRLLHKEVIDEEYIISLPEHNNIIEKTEVALISAELYDMIVLLKSDFIEYMKVSHPEKILKIDIDKLKRL